jgi:hypothetical protein
MNEKPLMERLSCIYGKQKFSWFVIDGQGNTMAEGLDELSAREYSMKDDSYSIGNNTIKPASHKLNAEGIPITYENKDVLSAEDLE